MTLLADLGWSAEADGDNRKYHLRRATMRTLASGMSIVLLLALGPGIVTPHVSAQASAVDPASLIGEWRGTMMPRGSSAGRGSARGGDYVLTITSVKGNTVRGQIVGPDEGSSGQLKGTLEKGTLHFTGGGGSKTRLTINGDSMEGVREGGGGSRNEWTVSLSQMK